MGAMPLARRLQISKAVPAAWSRSIAAMGRSYNSRAASTSRTLRHP